MLLQYDMTFIERRCVLKLTIANRPIIRQSIIGAPLLLTRVLQRCFSHSVLTWKLIWSCRLVYFLLLDACRNCFVLYIWRLVRCDWKTSILLSYVLMETVHRFMMISLVGYVRFGRRRLAAILCHWSLIKLPGTVVGPPSGFMFCGWCFFINLCSISPRDSWAPAANRCETLPWFSFIIQLPEVGGGSPRKIGGQECAKVMAISDNFRLWARITPERIEISKIAKTWSTEIPSAFGEKSLVNFGPLATKLDMWVWTHRYKLFQNAIFGPPWGAAHQIFTRSEEWWSLANPHPLMMVVLPTISNNERSEIG